MFSLRVLPAPSPAAPPSRRTAGARALAPANTPVLFFGTAEVSCLRGGALTRFEQGVRRGFHASAKTGRKEQAFRRALCEVEAWLRVRRAEARVRAEGLGQESLRVRRLPASGQHSKSLAHRSAACSAAPILFSRAPVPLGCSS